LATTVYDVLDIQLSDGSTIELKPLPIKQLRKFMEVIGSMASIDDADPDKAMDVFIKASMICLTNIRPDLATDQDKFEEIIETPTMMKILEVVGGLKLTDPNLLGAALVGTN
jgi:hypothetical protein